MNSFGYHGSIGDMGFGDEISGEISGDAGFEVPAETPVAPSGTGYGFTTQGQWDQDARMLNAIGYGVPMGTYPTDPAAMAVVKVFQQDVYPRAGTPDGKLGAKTRTVIQEIYAKQAGVPGSPASLFNGQTTIDPPYAPPPPPAPIVVPSPIPAPADPAPALTPTSTAGASSSKTAILIGLGVLGLLGVAYYAAGKD